MRLLLASVLLFVGSLQISFAQNAGNHVIEGTITGEKGEPLQGAVIEVKNSSTKAQTDAAGKFKITVPAKGSLLITSTGYTDQSITFTEATTTLNIVLAIDTKGMDEVVVVGYNTVKKKDLTGSVSGINSKDIRSRPVNNAVEAMQGKVAGVDISSNERPGQIGSINIRGVRSLTASNSPLFVVDGIPLITGGIDNINPGDIESIDVLKDASATAIYGSRGANGVVIVNTKQGKAGKVTVNFNNSLNFQHLVDNNTMFNAAEYIEYRRWAYYYAGLNPTTGISTFPRGDQPTIANDRVYFAATADPAAWANIARGWASGTWDPSKVQTTDWRGIVKQASVTSDNVISVSGGTDKVKAYASFGYLNNTGTIKGQAFDRYTVKANVDIAATKWLSIGSNVNISYGKQKFGQSNISFATIGGAATGLYESARSIFPYAVPFDSTGTRILYPGGDNAIRNVVDEWKYTINDRVTTRVFGSFNAQVNFGTFSPKLKGLKYRMNFGPDISHFSDGNYIDANSVANGGSTSFATYTNNKTLSYTLDHLLYYDRNFGDHTVGVTLLNSITKYSFETSRITGNGIPIPSQRWYALTSGTVTGAVSTASDLIEQQLLSYMARFNYGYKNKYLLTVSARQDGASQLAAGKKFSVFPSAALAWRIDKEKFINARWINELKLRLGAGVTGNSAIAPYATQGAINALFLPFGATNIAGAIPNSVLANQELGWEKTTQYNLGIDFQLFNSRLSGTVDVYTSQTKDLLMQRSIPTVTGFSTTFANIGQTANNGIDISITTTNVKTKNVTWTTTTNASWQKERIVSLSNGKQNDINNNWFIDQPIGVIYGFKALGLWQKSDTAAFRAFNANGNRFSPGSVRVADLNGDNRIDPNNDRTIIGWTRPRWIVGMTNTVNYKDFEFSIFVYGRLRYMHSYGGEVQAARSVNRKIDYYTENNPNAEFQKPIFNAGGAAGDPFFRDLGYLNASFLKIRNISLGYNVNSKKLKAKGLDNMKAYVQINNPGMLFSQIKFLDMDVVGPTWNRGFIVGINATF